MKIALITYNFYPLKDGISHTLTNLCKVFQNREDYLYVFNPHYKGKRIFDVLDTCDYKTTDLKLFLKNKQLLFLLFYSIWKIIKDKNTSISDKLHTLLYLLFRPKILIKTIKNIDRLLPYFKKIDFNIICGGSTGTRILPLVFFLSRIFNKKMVSLAHGNEFLIHTSLSLRSYYYRNLNRIIIHTKRLKDLLIKIHHLDENLIDIIPPGLNLKEYKIMESRSELREEYGIPKKCFVLLSVGRHVSRKNFNLVIRAVYEIKTKISNIPIKYFLIGSGPETRNLEKLVKKLGLEEEIQFLGDCDNLKRNKFYKLSNIFIMTSIAEKESIEGFGVVFLEANYFKLPVIASSSGGMGEAVVDNKTGLLVKPHDLADLVNKILYLYNSEDIRKDLGKNGYKRVINDFDWIKLYFEYLKSFKCVLNEK